MAGKLLVSATDSAVGLGRRRRRAEQRGGVVPSHCCARRAVKRGGDG